MFTKKELAKRISKLESALEEHIEATENSIKDLDAEFSKSVRMEDFGFFRRERVTIKGRLDALTGYLGVSVDLQKGKDTIKVKKSKKGKK